MRNRVKRNYQTEHRRRLRTKFATDQKNVPCVDCGVQYPHWVMDFDHVRGEKVDNVGTMVSKCVAEHKIQDEINKCDVVCANCHRQRTHSRIEANFAR